MFLSALLCTLLNLQSPTASCTVDTQGARIVSWRVRGEERLWNPCPGRDSQGRWAHGGIPLVWPWFGRTGPGGVRTIHGFAWRQAFAISNCTPSAVTLTTYSEHFAAVYSITLTDALTLKLTTTNVSAEPARANFGFHPYFRLTDCTRARAVGLESAHFDLPFTTAPDNVFACERLGGLAELRDEVSGYAIRVHSPDCGEFVVWNPGEAWPQEGYPEIDAFDSPANWRHFAALEPRVGTWKKLPALKPGESRTLTATFSIVKK